VRESEQPPSSEAAPPAAESRPTDLVETADERPDAQGLLDDWESLRRRLSKLLKAKEASPEWATQLMAFAKQLRQLAAQDADLALYFLTFSAGEVVDHYSAAHGMACAVVGELVGRWHGWPEEEVESLVHAALSMYVSMTTSQDALASQAAPPDERQQREIVGHADASAEFLAACGVKDALWLEVVRRHRVGADDGEVDAMEAAPRIAELVRRIDVYTAKLSRRHSRRATTPALAARDACLGRSGHPDSIGATLLRVLGLYPPGTWVTLSNGETGIVIARGAKAHTPIVAALRRADGGLLMQPTRRDTQLRVYAVVRGITTHDVRVRLHHLRALRC
jgi:HD-GYP domain-containing protein (c-di-GMP phosphodiesterase class II)